MTMMFLTSDIFVWDRRELWPSMRVPVRSMSTLEVWLNPYVRPVVRFMPARRVVISKASNPRWIILPNIVVVVDEGDGDRGSD